MADRWADDVRLSDIEPRLLCRACGNRGADARAVQADRMYLVAIGHRIVTLGKIADAVDRSDVAIHGIEALEHDQLRPFGLDPLKQLFEVTEIVVTPVCTENLVRVDDVMESPKLAQ
jgi:hypothetical protein